MARKYQLLIIVFIVVALAASCSYAIIKWLGIWAFPMEHRTYGTSDRKPFVFSEGSSLMGGALSLEVISEALERKIETWFVPGSSPSEWELLQKKAPNAELMLIGVSAYDLNEQILCDFRANFVPLRQTIIDLWHSGSDLNYSKRVISQYPVMYLRVLFPTVGRSQGVIGEMRAKIGKLFGFSSAAEIEAGPIAPTGQKSSIIESISNWPEGRMLRRIADMRISIHGKHSFNGSKKQALLRMLRQSKRQGSAVVIVLPVSSTYKKEFLTSAEANHFENSLADIQLKVRDANWIRLDKEHNLDSDEYFADIVHMNMFGQNIATEIVIKELKYFKIIQ